jgi:hypothetical protein
MDTDSNAMPENGSNAMPGNGRNTNLLKYLLIAGVLVLLFASNPNVEAHRDAVSQKVKKIMQRAVADTTNIDGDFAKAGAQLGAMLGGALAGKIVDEVVDRKNFVFFSLTTITFNGEEKVIGLGILGNVFLSSKVEQAI